MAHTLFVKRKLIANASQDQKELDNYFPIDYIINHFKPFVPTDKWGSGAQKKPTYEDKILILLSGVGSAKSTGIPPKLYETWEHLERNIVCVQPRVITTKEMHTGILQYNKNLILGKNIGYQTGPFTRKPIRGIIYMTIGTLYQQFITMTPEEIMNKYLFIVVDEAHERGNIVIDILFNIIKNFAHDYHNEPKCPFFIIMSATIDINKFLKYYELPLSSAIEVSAATTYPIDYHFLTTETDDWIQTAVDNAIKIHIDNEEDITSKSTFRDILVFAPTNKIIDLIIELLEKANTSLKYNYIVLKLTKDVIDEGGINYENIFIDYNKIQYFIGNKQIIVYRKIIISTDVAETGITIPTLKYVIDSGYINKKLYDPEFDVGGLVIKPVPKSNIIQRRGRIGRKAPGHWFPMYTESAFNYIYTEQLPAIITEKIDFELLDMIITEENKLNGLTKKTQEKPLTLKEFDINQINKYYQFETLDLLDMPTSSNIRRTINKLYILGLITIPTDLIDNDIRQMKSTMIGRIINKMRSMYLISIENAKMLLSAYAWKVSIIDLINIVVLMDFEFEKSNDAFLQNINLLIADDFIYSLVVFNEFYNFITASSNVKFGTNLIQQWCLDRGLQYQKFIKMLEIRDNLIFELARVGFNPFQFQDSLGSLINLYKADRNRKNTDDLVDYIKRIKQCIYEGYKLNIAKFNADDKKYYSEQNHIPLKITSQLLTLLPKTIIYPSVELKSSKFKNKYEFVVKKISILDGYIYHDFKIFT